MGQSINTAILMGRLTADPELKQTQSGLSVCSFRLAVDRRIKSQNGPDADFINCVVWRQGADYLCQYGFKGALTSVEGSIQTRSYKDNDDRVVYVTEIQANQVQLLSYKNETAKSEYQAPQTQTQQQAPQTQQQVIQQQPQKPKAQVHQQTLDDVSLDLGPEDLPF